MTQYSQSDHHKQDSQINISYKADRAFTTSSYTNLWRHGGAFLWKQQRVGAVGCFCGGALLLMFDRILKATQSEEGISTTGVNFLCLQILLIQTKHKTIKKYLGLSTRLHFLEGVLIHWVDKATCYQQSGRGPWKLDGELLPLSSGILAKTIHMRYSPCTLRFKPKQWTWFTPNEKTRWNLRPTPCPHFLHPLGR